MSLKQDGAIVILSSPSGAGKTTLVKKISYIKNFSISISYTTRIPRKNEVNGEDYYFISDYEFKKLISSGDLLEYAKVFNNYYGSSKNKVFNLVENGKNVIFDIDWQGTEQIKNKNLDCKVITFFVLPPSKKTLLNRLSERENNNKSVINERMKNFKSDVLHWTDYDYVVVNDNLEICLKQILDIIELELNNKKTDFNKDTIKSHVMKLID